MKPSRHASTPRYSTPEFSFTTTGRPRTVFKKSEGERCGVLGAVAAGAAAVDATAAAGGAGGAAGADDSVSVADGGAAVTGAGADCASS